MTSLFHKAISRRRLLQFLAASPLLSPAAGAERVSPAAPADPFPWAPRDLEAPIKDPRQALSAFDFEPVMKQNVPPAHFGYAVTGLDDEATLRANREGFLKFRLRPRRLVDVTRIDMSCDILGTTYDSPIVIAPTASNQAFHPDGELLFCGAMGWKRGDHQGKDIDAITANNERVQIKSRRMTRDKDSDRSGAIYDKEGFDLVAIAMFDPQFRIKRAIIIPRPIALAYLKWSSRQKGWYISLTKSFWKEARLIDVTARLALYCQEVDLNGADVGHRIG